MGRISFIRQISDKGRNIHAGNAAPVLRAELYRRIVGDDKLPPVALYMIIHAVLESLQNGGLPMIAAAHKKGDAPWYPHACHLSLIRQSNRHFQRIRAFKGNRTLHGSFGHPAFSWKNGAVGHKSAQRELRKLFPDILLVLAKANRLFELVLIDSGKIKALSYAVRQNIKKHLFQLSCVNGSPVCRKTRLKPKGNISVLYLKRRPLKHLLPASGNSKQAALAGALCLKASAAHLPAEKPRQMILKCNSFGVGIIKLRRKARFLRLYQYGKP